GHAERVRSNGAAGAASAQADEGDLLSVFSAAQRGASDRGRPSRPASSRLSSPGPAGEPPLNPTVPAAGLKDYVGDPRNDDVFISVNGEFVRRPAAKVSVFDSGFVLGDGVWEGLRLNGGRIAFFDKPLDRLWDGAKMLRIDIGLTREALAARV